MQFQDLVNGPLGILFVLSIAHLLPPAVGYRLAEKLGRNIAHNTKSHLVQAVRTNQWVVSGCKFNLEELNRATEQVFINHGRALYDYYRFFRDRDRTDKKVILDDSFMQVIEHSQRRDKAQLLLMPHYANYDLSAIAAANHGLTMQVLSFPNPGRGYRWQNKFRNVHGIEVTPISISSLRMAIQNLNEGGTVFTGVDRPYGDSTLRPVFFERPSSVPTGYIRLATKTGVPIQVVLCSTSREGKYILAASEPIPILRDQNPVQEQLINIHRVLTVIEEQIKRNPTFWSMFYPVWPELMKSTPRRRGNFGKSQTRKKVKGSQA